MTKPIVTNDSTKIDMDSLNAALVRSGITENQHGWICWYIIYGIIPGRFLAAVLANDLTQAVAAGSKEDFSLLKEYIAFLRRFAPKECWGSPSKVNKWCKAGGKAGVDNA